MIVGTVLMVVYIDGGQFIKVVGQNEMEIGKVNRIDVV